MRAFVAFWIVFTAAVLFAIAAAPKRVAFIDPPHVVSEGQTAVFQIRVEPNADNRVLVLAASDGDFIVRRSDEQLDGASAPRTRWIRWLLPRCEGDCLIIAALYGVGGQELARASTQLIVVHPGP